MPTLSRKQARELGIPVEGAKRKRKRKRRPAQPPEVPAVFARMLEDAGLPQPVAEHRFHPVRRWRFDFAFIEQMIALEVEGGAWTQGRHTRGSGFVKDMDKYNAATAMGWRVLRVTPQQLETEYTINLIRETMSEH